jgi:hypothetical protein
MVDQQPQPQVPFTDLRYVVWCPECKVHDTARCLREGTATLLCELHERTHGHHPVVRDLEVEDVNLP